MLNEAFRGYWQVLGPTHKSTLSTFQNYTIMIANFLDRIDDAVLVARELLESCTAHSAQRRKLTSHGSARWSIIDAEAQVGDSN